METEERREKQPITATFQTASELLGKKQGTNYSITKSRNSLFDEDDPLMLIETGMQRLLREGYCQHCLNTKPTIESCRKVTNKLNLFAHFCTVCSALFGYGSEFIVGIKSLDNFELLSLDEQEMLVIKAKDRAIYERLLGFKDQFSQREGSDGEA